jgi:hypothetical protein
VPERLEATRRTRDDNDGVHGLTSTPRATTFRHCNSEHSTNAAFRVT